jgi:type IV pilus assembly protein PilW
MNRQAGLTLVEMMVAMAIGVFLTWGAIQMYASSKRNYTISESMSRLQENGRFALETMEPDIRMAGYWGQNANGAGVVKPAGISVTCAGGAAFPTALDTATPVEATDDSYTLPCAPNTVARPGSDVLIVRHATGERQAPQPGQIQVRGGPVASALFNDGSAGGDIHGLVVDAYYVDSSSSFTPNTPSLRRFTLEKNGLMTDEEIAAGVENLQVQYGIDTNGDGAPDRYVDTNNPAVLTSRIVAVRIWMLIREETQGDRSFVDDRTYAPPDADLPVIAPGSALYPAGFRRIEMSRTIYLRNPT